ncbi:MAG: NAD-dependent epimerase/dehydratase family protein [Puia sp.]|nr:NAD-dependent epimerase/dehydratase family protein [Puia sp.]
MALHTLLGANGTIATELVPILLSNKESVRLVSRNPRPVAGATVFAADVLDPRQVLEAVKGSDIVYLLVGLEYNHKVWENSWPLIMNNTVEACKTSGARLVFFDNIYMYGKVAGKITEDTPYHPISKKGTIRAGVDRLLTDEMKKGAIRALIAKATDFYGPRCTDKSATGVMVFERLRQGKKPQWFVNSRVPRSFNYTPDAAKALYLLANSQEAYGQTWHLPVATPTPNGREFAALASKYMKGNENKRITLQVIPKWLIGVIGWFNPFMKEMYEMMYQNEFPLELDSTKFERVFSFTPTSYEEGIRATAAWYLTEKGSSR